MEVQNIETTPRKFRLKPVLMLIFALVLMAMFYFVIYKEIKKGTKKPTGTSSVQIPEGQSSRLG